MKRKAVSISHINQVKYINGKMVSVGHFGSGQTHERKDGLRSP